MKENFKIFRKNDGESILEIFVSFLFLFFVFLNAAL